MNSIPRIILPDKWQAVAGDTLQLFYRGMIEHPFPYVYNIEFLCDMGKNTPRYFEVTPTAEQAGLHPVTLNLRDCHDNIVASASSVIEVYPSHVSPCKNKNILCVGDSLTSGGIWCDELNRRLTETDGTPKGDGLENITFIGTKKRGKTGFEGYGGWTWESYLIPPPIIANEMMIYSNHNKSDNDQHSLWKDENGGIWKLETILEGKIKLIRQQPFADIIPKSGTLHHMSNAVNSEPIVYTDAQSTVRNPFWDTESGKVSFKSYCERNGFEGIDIMCTLLTWNGGGCYLEEGGKDRINRQVELAEKFLRIFHVEYPEAKVLMMGIQLPSLNGGCGASYGAGIGPMSNYANSYALCRYVMEMNIAYQALANLEEFSGYVEFVNISAQFDSENNMPEADKPVNLRNTKTEKVGTNGVHPTTEGYYQIADAVYRSIKL